MDAKMIGVLVTLAALPQLVSAPPAPVEPPKGVPPNVEALSDYTVSVSPAGQAEDCRLRAPSGYASLDAKGCAVIRQARFAPARDASSAPVYGSLNVQVQWPQGQVALGLGAPDVEFGLSRMPPGVSGRPVAHLALAVGPTGVVETCDVLGGAGSADFNSYACTTGVKDAKIAPVKAADGSPARSVQALNVRFAAYAHFASVPADLVAEVYPDRARKLDDEGFAVIRCNALAQGRLDGCTVDEESPPGFGFGQATLRLVKEGDLRTTPDQIGEVFIVMKYQRR
jgi:TonB family protein